MAAADVRRRLGTPEADIPSAVTIARIASLVLQHYRQGLLANLPRRALKYVPWSLFASPEEVGPPIHEEPGLFSAVMALLRDRGTGRIGLALAQCYLRHYDPESKRLEELRLLARSLLKNSRHPKAAGLLTLSQEYGLLEGKGHPRLVEAFMTFSKPADDCLADAGLSGELAFHGFVEFAFRQLQQRLRKRLANGNIAPYELERILGFAVASIEGRSELRFGPQLSAGLVEALLEPFEKGDPPEDVKEVIKAFMLEWYGDPRLKPQSWTLVSAVAIRVMRRWLVAATLEDFFQILDENTERYADADRQWPYRRAFWTAYLERDQISEAWVALGRRVLSDSRRQLKEVSAKYGELRGARSDHAVLIMQVNDLVVTEWSHSGKYRLWHADSSAAPSFYKSLYYRDELVERPDFDGSHHGTEGGRWQGTLSNYIRRQTGVKIGLRELMP